MFNYFISKDLDRTPLWHCSHIYYFCKLHSPYLSLLQICFSLHSSYHLCRPDACFRDLILLIRSPFFFVLHTVFQDVSWAPPCVIEVVSLVSTKHCSGRRRDGQGWLLHLHCGIQENGQKSAPACSRYNKVFQMKALTLIHFVQGFLYMEQ